MKPRSPVRTSHSRRPARPTRPIGADCDTWRILSGHSSRLERDLAGRLFIVKHNVSHHDVSRREISYREALEFITEHTFWKHPWKMLAHHGIKRPSAA
jgi:hypothetical protein